MAMQNWMDQTRNANSRQRPEAATRRTDRASENQGGGLPMWRRLLAIFLLLTMILPSGLSLAETDGNAAEPPVYSVNNALTADVRVFKVWDDANNEDGIRPESVTVELQADGETVENGEVELNEGNSWTHAFEALPVYKQNAEGGYDEIVYSLVETLPENESWEKAEDEDVWSTDAYGAEKKDLTTYTEKHFKTSIEGGVVLTLVNRHEPAEELKYLNKYLKAEADLEGVKTLEGRDMKAGEFTFTLTRTEETEEEPEEPEEPIEPNGEGEDTAEEPAEALIYSAQNEAAEADENGEAETAFTIEGISFTHKDAGKTFTFTLSEEFDDKSVVRTEPVEDIVFTIHVEESVPAEGEKPVLELYLNDSSEPLEIGEDGVYHLADALAALEPPVEIEFINKYETRDIKVVKAWDDADDRDGLRPDYVLVVLMADGEAVASYRLTAEEDWTHTFEDLPLRNKETGEIIVYSVEEESLALKQLGYQLIKVVETYDEEGADSEEKTPANPAVLEDREFDEADPDKELYVREVELTNHKDSEETEVTVRKIWNDEKNKDGLRPMTAVFKITAADEQGNPIAWTAEEDGLWYGLEQPAEPSEEGETEPVEDDQDETVWPPLDTAEIAAFEDGEPVDGSYTWEHLPVNYKGGKVTYTVEEIQLIDGEGEEAVTYTYDAEKDCFVTEEGEELAYSYVMTGSQSCGFTATNTHVGEETTVTVHKLWDDADDRDGVRPDSVTVRLFRQEGEEGEKEQIALVTLALEDETESYKTWSYTFEHLPKNSENGVEYIYTVEEDAVAEYNKESTEDAPQPLITYTDPEDGSRVAEITNYHKPETVDVQAEKVWEDNDNQDGKRPTTITFTLSAEDQDGEAIAWTDAGLFKDMLEEGESVPAAEQTITVIDEEGRPVEEQKAVWESLPKYYKGQQVWYVLTEKAVGGLKWKEATDTAEAGWYDGDTLVYTTEVDGDQKSGFTVTNTHAPEGTEVTVKKTWIDNNNADGLRPEYILLTLRDAEGNSVFDLAGNLIEDIKLTEIDRESADTWTYTFRDLPKYKEGAEVGYEVTEQLPADDWNEVAEADLLDGELAAWTYKKDENVRYALTSKEQNEDTGVWELENTYEQVTTEIHGVKIWQDDDNRDGKRPQATLYLLKNGEKTDPEATAVITDENRENVVAVTMTIAEGAVTGSTTAYPAIADSTDDYAWLDEEAEYAWTFTNLPKYENGREIAWSVIERSMIDSSADISYKVIVEEDGSDPHSFVVTNIHTPELTSVTAVKIWEDEENEEGFRPDRIQFTLEASYVNDEGEETAIEWSNAAPAEGDEPAPAGLWYGLVEDPEDIEDQEKEILCITADGELLGGLDLTVIWKNLPVYYQGKKVTYTVTETDMILDGEHYVWKDADDTAEPAAAAGWYKDGMLVYTTEIEQDAEDSEAWFVTNRREAETVEIPVWKVWKDNNNQDGTRPDGVYLTLFEQVGEGEKTALQTVLLTADDVWEEDETGNTWTYTFEDLPKYRGGEEIVYTVDEQLIPKDYAKTIDKALAADEDGEYPEERTVINSKGPDETEVKVEKIFDDEDDADGVRPESVTVALYADGEPVPVLDEEGEETGEYVTVVLSGDNEWKHTFEHLPKNKLDEEGRSQAIVYTVRETGADGYTLDESTSTDKVFVLQHNEYDDVVYEGTVSGCMGQGYVVENTHKPVKISIPVTKVWVDQNNLSGRRPDSVTVKLLANGKQAGLVTLSYDDIIADIDSEGNTVGEKYWSWMFTDLAKYDENGEVIEYTVTESSLPGFEWRNGDETAEPPVVEGWYQDDKLIYTTAYEQNDEEDVTKGFTVINTAETETTELTVQKVWRDNNDQDSMRPESVTVTLYADGEQVERDAEGAAIENPVIIKEADDWTHTFEGLARYRAGETGQEIEYTVKETAVDGLTWKDEPQAGWYDGDTLVYTTLVGEARDGTVIVTNIHDTDLTEVPFYKFWNDSDNRDGKRPDHLKIQLNKKTEDGLVAIEDKFYVLTEADKSAANTWSYTFTDLPAFEDGAPIVYVVTEEEVADYTADPSDGAEMGEDGRYTIVNTHGSETGELAVIKVWDDADDQDGLRQSIELTLSGNGLTVTATLTKDGLVVVVGSVPEGVTVTDYADEDGHYGIRYSGLPVYEAGQVGVKAEYTVSEAAVEGYETVITPNPVTINEKTTEDDTELILVTVTNTHAPETIEIPVSKTWEDNDDQDGKRPTSIKVKLTAKVTGDDGAETELADLEQTVSLTTDDVTGDWTYTFTDLPKYHEGREIAYDVEEILPEMTKDEETNVWSKAGDTDADYTEEKSGDQAEGFAFINTHESVQMKRGAYKIWDDAENQDGVRPVSVTYILYRNGEEAERREVTEADVIEIDGEEKTFGWWFEGLDKYEQGVEINWQIAEAVIDGYTTSLEKTEGDEAVFAFTNTHAPEETSVTAMKVWDDADDQDGLRPAQIVFTLKASYTDDEGEAHEIEWAELETEEEEQKTIEVFVDGEPATGKDLEVIWEKLPRNYEGFEIVYTVEETVMTDLTPNEDYTAWTKDGETVYTTEYSGDQAEGYVITNRHETATVDVPVWKRWDDSDDQDGLRPEAVMLTLYATAGGETKAVDSVKLSAEDLYDGDETGNTWTYTFEGLPEKEAGETIVYTVDEQAIPAKYEKTLDTDPAGEIDDRTVVNTLEAEKTEVPFEKIWNDSDDQDGARPAQVVITLVADGEETELQVTLDGEADEPAEGESGEYEAWKGRFSSLPKYAAGEEIIYSVKETAVIDADGNEIAVEDDAFNVDPDTYENGYTVTYCGGQHNGFKVINTHETEETEVPVVKYWVDFSNQDGVRPAYVEFQLYKENAEGEETAVGEPVKLTGEDIKDTWEYTYTRLPKFEGGKEIKYVVRETGLAGLTWKDDGWYDAEGVLVYTTDNDRLAKVETDEETGEATEYKLINRHESETTELTVRKVWRDNNDQDGVRPEMITVEVLADGEELEYPYLIELDGTADDLGEDEAWTAVFTGLTKYREGQKGEEIVYTAVEKAMDGLSWKDEPEAGWYDGDTLVYTTLVGEVKDGSVTITNSHDNELTEVPFYKFWDDSDNQDGKRPDHLKIQLNKKAEDGSLIVITDRFYVLTEADESEANTWSYTFTDLPAYEDGEKIVYVVTEEEVADYEAAPAEGAELGEDGLYTIVNTHDNETGELAVVKVWNDGEDQDGLRKSIELTLSGNGLTVKATLTKDGLVVVVGSVPEGVTVTDYADADGHYGIRYSGLPVYEAGQVGVKAEYTVSEAAVEGYETVISPNPVTINEKTTEDDTELTLVTVTNTHVPETTSIRVRKHWKDNDGIAGLRPFAYCIVLRGKVDGETVLSFGPNFPGTATEGETYFNDLPVYWKDQNGESRKIEYVVEEVFGYWGTYGYDGQTWEYLVEEDWTRGTDEQGHPTWTWNFDPTVVYTLTRIDFDEQGTSWWSEDEKMFTFTLENTLTVGPTEISGEKVWKDDENRDGKRPDAVLYLLKNGEKVVVDGEPVTLTLTEANRKLITVVRAEVKDGRITGITEETKENETGSEYAWQFTDLPKYEDGKPIRYSIVEQGMIGESQMIEYKTVIKDNEDGTYTVTNTYTPGRTSVTAVKVWKDSNNQDGLRPVTIEFTLKASYLDETGEETEIAWTKDAATEESAAGLWYDLDGDMEEQVKVLTCIDEAGELTDGLELTAIWQNLPLKYQGRDVIYTVEETAMTGLEPDEANTVWTKDGKAVYTTEITGDQTEGYEVTNTHAPELTEVPARKTWDDNDDQDALRPETIVLTLMADGKAVATVQLSEADAEADDPNTWSYTFEDLPRYKDGQEITYTVEEEQVPARYTLTKGEDGTLINTHAPEETEVPVRKIWNDNEDQDGARPAEVIITLYADGEEATDEDGSVITLTLNEGNGWAGTFEHLPKYDGKNEIIYSVKETAVIDAEGNETAVENDAFNIDPDTYENGYTVTYCGGQHGEDGFKVINTHETEETELELIKKWRDEQNRDGVRPDHIGVTLYADGEPYAYFPYDEEVLLTGDMLADDWSYTFLHLPKYKDGKEIEYTLLESSLGLLTQGTATINGVETVVWLDAEGNMVYSTWNKAWAKYNEALDAWQLMNQHETEMTEIVVTKSWADVSDRDGMRPESVTITLYADGVATDRVITLDGETDADLTEKDYGEKEPWKAYFSDLPRYRVGGSGEEIVYTAKETGMKGWTKKTETDEGITWTADGVADPYTTNLFADESNDYTITNTHAPETVGVEILKVWNDNDDQDGMRPTELQVNLIKRVEGKEDEVFRTFTLTKGTGWTAKLKGLYRFEQGVEIQYVWDEIQIDGYVEEGRTVEVYQDGKTTVTKTTITNGHGIEYTKVSVTKVWDDNDDQDGLRQDVTIRLMKRVGSGSETQKDAKVIRKGATGDELTVTWENLPVYEDGEKVVYTVVEDDMDGYTAVLTGSEEDRYTFTNTHAPETIDIPVTKIWADKDDQDGKRPASVTVNLLAGDETVDTAELTAPAWTHTFTGLPVYAEGEKIAYTIVEHLPDGWTVSNDGVWILDGDEDSAYTVAVTGDAETGFTLTNTHEVILTDTSVEKVWEDNKDQDGARPTELEVILLADGEVYGTYTLTRGQNWKLKVSNLPKYKGGSEITYTWQENENAMGSGYRLRTTEVDTENRTTTFYNEYSPEVIDVRVLKVWNDHDDEAGKRPESITVTLSDGTETIRTIVLNEQGGWEAVVTGLPRYADGQEIRYAWTEDTAALPAGYSLSGIYTEGYVTTITNTYNPETTSVTVRKVWDDQNDQDGKRPEAITVELFANGESLKRVELSEENGWIYTEQNLPQFTDGVRNVYTWSEDESGLPEGYRLTGTEVIGTVTTFTNSYTPETVSVTVLKVWDDGNDRDGIRPTELDVFLYADGVKLDDYNPVTLTRGKGWTKTIQNLPKYKAGELIEYTFAEDENGLPEGYELVSTETAGYITTITNTYAFEKVEVPVVKIWNDVNAKEGVRPASVTVKLLGQVGETTVETRTAYFTGGATEESWSYTFQDLPKRDENGDEIAYSVQEVQVEGYETRLSGDQTGYVIENTYTSTGKAHLEAEKMVSGEEPMDVDDDFYFELFTAEVDEEAMTLLGVSDESIALVKNEGSAVTFPEISYDLSEANQTYWFLISEQIPEDSVAYEYDETRFVAGVTITDNGDGTLNADIRYYEVDEDNLKLTALAEGEELPVFNNLRSKPSSLSITKTVVGKKTDRHFTFHVTLRDEKLQPLVGEYPYTITDGDGKIKAEGSFTLIESDLGVLSFYLMDDEIICIENLPLGAHYAVTEDESKAYITTAENNDYQVDPKDVTGTIPEEGASVKFKNTQVETEFRIRKIWVGGDPGWSIPLIFGKIVDGEFVELSIIDYPFSTPTTNVYLFEHLPKYDDDDKLIVYAAKEGNVAGYGGKKYDNPGSAEGRWVLDGGTITNTKTTEFRVRKLWTGVKADEELPEITLVLWRVHADGTYEVAREVKVKLKDGEWYTFYNLPDIYTYYVTEDAPDGFAVEYDNGAASDVTTHADNYGNIINHKIPKTGDNDPVELWTMMAVTGLLGLAALLILRKKREQRV